MNNEKIIRLTGQLLSINKAIYKALDICFVLQGKFNWKKHFDIVIEIRLLSKSLHRTTTTFYNTGTEYARLLSINNNDEQLTRVQIVQIVQIAADSRETL